MRHQQECYRPAILNTDHCKILSLFNTVALGCVWKNTLTPARTLQAHAVLNPGHYNAALGCVCVEQHTDTGQQEQYKHMQFLIMITARSCLTSALLPWAVSLHTDISKNTKAVLKCCNVLHTYMGTIYSRDKLLT